MQPGKTREQLEENLLPSIAAVRRMRRNTIEDIKRTLLENNKIIGGNIQAVLNNPKEELANLDWRVLLLLSEQLYKATGNSKINPQEYYTPIEIQKARQYSGKLFVEGDISLPLVLEDVTQLSYDVYSTNIDVKKLAEMSSLLLNYNFDVQREARTKIVDGETIREATIIMKNVEEIKKNLLTNKQEVTQIVINAGAGTSYDGVELNYDPENRTLKINEGTVLDIIDGYHRCKASELAINENPDIDFKFTLLILNYTDDQAMRYQGQYAKQTLISNIRQKQLSQERHADKIVKTLNTQSELAGRISDLPRPLVDSKDIVSYAVLTNTIDKEFDIKNIAELHFVGEYLVDFFDMLISYYESEFGEKLVTNRESSLLVENNMFAGYVALARKMYENEEEVVNLVRYLDNIDFNKNNSLWKKLGVLDDNKNLKRTDTIQKTLREYFGNLEKGER